MVIDILDILNKNATLIYSILIIGSMSYAGITVFARWIATKFLNKFEVKIREYKLSVDNAVKKQEDLLYDTSTKFEVAITKLTSSFGGVEKSLNNVESEVKEVKEDVHDVAKTVNDHLVQSAIKRTELDNKLQQHDIKLDNHKERINDVNSKVNDIKK